jgi:hypothetical protein
MRKNIVRGVLIAPFASGVLHGLLMQNWVAFIFAVVFAYAFTLAVGLPTFLLLERNDRVSLPYLLTAGFMGGSAIGIFFIGVDFQVSSILLGELMFASHGMLVAFVFWLVALRTKPSPREFI